MKLTGEMTLREIASRIHENAANHGWWDEERTVPELLCLIHSEVSEALEAYRENDWEHIGEELADIIIRTLDMAEGLGFDIQAELIRKHHINLNRTYRHGGKAC